jgi:hypothetical protein
MAVISNQLKGKVVLHYVANSANVIIAGNSTVSNVALSTENIGGATVRKVAWSSNGTWTVARGANTLLILHGAGSIDFSAMGMGLNLDPAANISFTHWFYRM